MADRCPQEEHYAALLVTAIAGVRPAEMKLGVSVQLTESGILVVTIHGAKVTLKTGQPIRVLKFRPECKLTVALANVVAAQGRGGCLAVTIADPRKFCDFVRALSRRVFSNSFYTVSPYSFRHAFAADQKARGVPPEMLAQMMGHVATRAQRGYGVAAQGRYPLASVIEVFATRPIRRKNERPVVWRNRPSGIEDTP
jgi:hypothetical protein